MKSFAFAVVFASSLLAISLAAKCMLKEGAWKSDTNDLSSRSLKEGIKVFSRFKFDMSNCGAAAIKDCEEKAQKKLEHYRSDMDKENAGGLIMKDDYCRYFKLPQPRGWRFGTFLDIEGCNVPVKFIGLLFDGEACCYDKKFGC